MRACACVCAVVAVVVVVACAWSAILFVLVVEKISGGDQPWQLHAPRVQHCTAYVCLGIMLVALVHFMVVLDWYGGQAWNSLCTVVL